MNRTGWGCQLKRLRIWKRRTYAGVEAVDGDSTNTVVLDDLGQCTSDQPFGRFRQTIEMRLTLSSAPWAPPPIMVASPFPFKLKASSQTLDHQTF